ncbi:hypothetical protein [Streptosporangium sp. CA-115845]|uniref:hypothetical protein n=1 Tax=Streptosporangium sp. CA-115845 TaxID=3240071 RepID=UPI003D8EE615
MHTALTVLTVAALRAILAALPEQALIAMTADAAGNGFSPMIDPMVDTMSFTTGYFHLHQTHAGPTRDRVSREGIALRPDPDRATGDPECWAMAGALWRVLAHRLSRRPDTMPVLLAYDAPDPRLCTYVPAVDYHIEGSYIRAALRRGIEVPRSPVHDDLCLVLIPG